MDRKELISFLFTQIGVDGLTELVHQGKISLEEYKKAVGVDCAVDLFVLKNVLREKLRAYKWIKAEQPFLYDGYLQKNKINDRDMMRDCMDALEKGVKESIDWKLPNETYKTITDYKYFLNMKATSTLITQKCFAIEETMVKEINALTEETIRDYNVEDRFDDLF